MARTAVPAPLPTRSNTSASSSSSSSNSATPNHSHHHGFRSQLGHLLPRHALFQVHLSIEELSNVPLVKGQFAVRWKFKSVQSGSGLLSKMKAGNSGRSTSSGSTHTHTGTTGDDDPKSLSAYGKGKAKAFPSSPNLKMTTVLPDSQSDKSSGFDSAYATPIDEDHQSIWTRNSTSSSSSRSYHKPSHSLTHSNEHSELASPITTPTPIPPPPSATPTIKGPMPPPDLPTATYSHVDPKGMTEWADLHSYNAKWDQKVSVVVQMDVHRETEDLLPNELKLVVMQRVISGDPDAPRNPRLGAVYLNLAEYADAGSVTRRYLLRESKINATLKLTVHLTHVGGAKLYKPPPLRKGEIMAEVSGFLTNNDLFRTRLARTLDLYSRDDLPSAPNDHDPDPDPDPLLIHEHELISDPNPNPTQTAEMADNPGLTQSALQPQPQRPRMNRLFSHRAPSGPSDIDRLASLNGLHNTENLIEAIFNPVPTLSQDASPFTYFSPEEAEASARLEREAREARVKSARMRDENSSLGGGSEEAASLSSVSGQSHGSGSGGRGGNRKDSSSYARSELSSLSNEGRDFGIRDFFSSSSHHSSHPNPHDDPHSGTSKTHWWQKMGGSRSRPGTPNVASGTKKLFGASSTRLPLEVE